MNPPSSKPRAIARKPTGAGLKIFMSPAVDVTAGASPFTGTGTWYFNAPAATTTYTLTGFGGAVTVVAGRTLLQRATDDRILARVSAAGSRGLRGAAWNADPVSCSNAR